MKRLVLIVLLALVSAAPTYAEMVTVAWDPNPPAESVTGYVLYHGSISRSDVLWNGYDAQTDVGDVTQHSVDVPVGEFLALTAYNAAGMSSAYSLEVQTTAAPAVPGAPGEPAATVDVVDGLGRTITVTVTIQ